MATPFRAIAQDFGQDRRRLYSLSRLPVGRGMFLPNRPGDLPRVQMQSQRPYRLLRVSRFVVGTRRRDQPACGDGWPRSDRGKFGSFNIAMDVFYAEHCDRRSTSTAVRSKGGHV
jgi:hypothetical protein